MLTHQQRAQHAIPCLAFVLCFAVPVWSDEVLAMAGPTTPPCPRATPTALGALALVPELDLCAETDGSHPLASVIRKMWAGEFGEQPEWRISLLIQGLRNQPVTAKATAFSTRCPDGGGPTTRWGSAVRRGICAADPRYWGPGSVLWFGPPVEQMLIVEDTGGAIKGRHRFDICLGDDAAACRRFGVRRIEYIPLCIMPAQSRWGAKPADWRPPVDPVRLVLTCSRPAHEPQVARRDESLEALKQPAS